MPICKYFYYFWFKYETSFIFEPNCFKNNSSFLKCGFYMVQMILRRNLVFNTGEGTTMNLTLALNFKKYVKTIPCLFNIETVISTHLNYYQ